MQQIENWIQFIIDMKNSGKMQVLLGRVNVEICYRNAKVDMN